jgi:hypothetical protein
MVRNYKQPKFDVEPLIAKLRKYTHIKNYGQGKSSLKIIFGKGLNEKAFQDRMFAIDFKCDDCGSKKRYILHADELKEIMRFM